MNRGVQILVRTHEFVERLIIIVLLVVLMAVVLFATGVLTAELVERMVARIGGGPPIDRGEMAGVLTRFNILHDVFGGFLLILIGVELMKTIAIYLKSHEMHVDVVFTVAIIGITRHAIDLDLAHLSAVQLVGLGTLLIALALGYYLFRKTATLGSSESAGQR